MGWYIAKRLVQLIPVFIGATLLVYAMVFFIPGDPIAAMFGDKGVQPEVAAQLRAQYHLDQPLYMQYLIWLGGIFRGDLGTAFTNRPVAEVVAQAYPVTIRLAVVALCFEAIIGVIVGVVAGLKKGKVFDSTALVVSLLLIAVPTFVMGLVLQYVFGIKLSWFPATVGTNQSLSNFLIPGFVLASVSIAYVLRLTRTAVAENSSADYVRTATAKGLGRSRVVTRHILRNSLIPVVTFLGYDLGSLMGGAIVTEGIFNIPGVGNTLYQAITRGEGPTIVSLVTILVLVFMVSSLVVDLLYAAIDPRIRLV